MNEMISNTSQPPPRAISWLLLFTLLLISSHIPLIGELIPITVLAPLGISTYILWHGMGRLDAKLVAYFISASSVATFSYLINQENPLVSPTSLVYLIYLLSPFTLRLTIPEGWRTEASEKFWQGYRYLMLLTSILGLIQLLLMDSFVSFRDALPETFRINGYNTTNAITYGGSIYRANGFFFYEPSFFSQFLGLAILVEIRKWRNPIVIILFAAAMLASFSGTGLIMLGLGLLLIASSTISASKMDALIALLPLLIITWVGVYVFPEFFISRLEEFAQENSSAYIRFISPFIYVYESYTSSFTSMLIGVGPGLAGSLRDAEIMADFPGIGKILFEYGLLGVSLVLAIYFRFCTQAMMTSWILLPIILIQFVLNNGIFTPITLTFFIFTALFSTPQCLPAPSRLHATQEYT